MEINRLDRNGSIAVLSTIVALLLLYVVVMIIARRADNRDKLKVWTVSNPLHLSTPLIITFRFDYEYETEILRTSVKNLVLSTRSRKIIRVVKGALVVKSKGL